MHKKRKFLGLVEGKGPLSSKAHKSSKLAYIGEKSAVYLARYFPHESVKTITKSYKESEYWTNSTFIIMSDNHSPSLLNV